MTADPKELSKEIGYTFKSRKLLDQALTHSSIKDEENPSNERLEFLGDAVLGLVTTEYLYRNFPDLDEGDMTAIKSVVVSRESLLKIAQGLKLRRFLSVGKGISKKRTMPSSLIADAVEAFIGALYLDGGYRAAKQFTIRATEPLVAKVLKKRTSRNYKSMLQAYAQKKFGATPYYRLVNENGPDHKKVFELSAVVCDRTFPPGKGNSKKVASLQAARNALKILQGEYGKLPSPSK